MTVIKFPQREDTSEFIVNLMNNRKNIWAALGHIRKAQHELLAIDAESDDILDLVAELNDVAVDIVCYAKLTQRGQE